MTLRRREVCAFPLAAAAQPRPSRFRLIAHRGGVVGPGKPENSRESLEAAIASGYWMAEIDVRATSDGEPVLYHDPTLEKEFADPRRPEDLTWGEMRRLQSRTTGRPPLHFEEACRISGGRIRFMLDLKGRGWPQLFYMRLLRHLDDAKVPGPIYSLGGPRVRPLFQERVQVSLDAAELRERSARNESLQDGFFLFMLASEMRREDFELAQRRNITPVAAINTFRYTMERRDEEAGPAEDASRLIQIGVDTFQIDSRYERLFR